MSISYLASTKLPLYRPKQIFNKRAIKEAFIKSFANEQRALKSFFAFSNIFVFDISDPPSVFNTSEEIRMSLLSSSFTFPPFQFIINKFKGFRL